MARKFNFFDWAAGNPSRFGRDFRRLLIVLGSVLGVFGLLMIGRLVFWKGDSNEGHPHEKGPHGGMVVAIDKGASHNHVEILVEEDGRIHLYLSGDHAEKPVQVPHQLLVGQVKPKVDEASTSLILRPEEKADETTKKTSHFLGRLSPEMMGSPLSVSIAKMEIDGAEVSFQFEMPGLRQSQKRAAELVKTFVLAPKGQYTLADIDAEQSTVPTERYLGLKVVHDLRPEAGDSLCPVTLAKADLRIRWQVAGRVYQFCCAPCIVDFIDVARASLRPLIAPEQLVKKS